MHYSCLQACFLTFLFLPPNVLLRSLVSHLPQGDRHTTISFSRQFLSTYYVPWVGDSNMKTSQSQPQRVPRVAHQGLKATHRQVPLQPSGFRVLPTSRGKELHTGDTQAVLLERKRVGCSKPQRWREHSGGRNMSVHKQRHQTG